MDLQGRSRIAGLAGVVVVAVLAGLTGWLGLRDHRARADEHLRTEMVQVARQGVVNLTTIDHQRVEQDVQRILDSSTGAFHDDFAGRAEPFIDAAKKAQSTSVGTVTEAGLESLSGDEGRVLVALTVMTSNRGVPEQQPKLWRVRVTVTKTGDGIKVAQVEFVP